MNVLVLAYLGDAVYEKYVREYLIQSFYKVDELQKQEVKYVGAKGQAAFLRKQIDANFFTQEELDIIKRGRNNKRATHPKNVDIVTYKYSTAFECLLGTLYLEKNIERMEEIIKRSLEEPACI